MACCFPVDSFQQDDCILQILDASGNIQFEIDLTKMTMVDQSNGLFLTDGTNSIVLSPEDQTQLGLDRTALEALRDACQLSSQVLDYYAELAFGNIPGARPVLIRGHNPSQTAASGFVDVSEFGDIVYLSAAETMDIVSDDAADTSAGTGLRTLVIIGVDDTGAEIQETIVMNGLTVVTTVNSYLRVNFMVGLTAGSTGWNEGSITAKATVATTTQCQMNATQSISQNSHFTVPLGTSFYIIKQELNNVRDTGFLNPIVEWKGYARQGGAGAAWIQLFNKKFGTGVTDDLDIILPIPSIPFTERTDIRLQTDVNFSNTESRSRMYGILRDN